MLVPANDPWQMAYAIINLVNDKERMIAFSNNARQAAETRHNPERIKEQLFNCYNQLLDKENRISSGKW